MAFSRGPAEGVVKNVNPAEPIDCILNIAILEKKTLGSVRMNIDPRPYNKGAKHTRYQVTTPQEATHELKGAKVFSEFDMGNVFHQVPLHTCSQVIFQLHLGLHGMKRIFFGQTISSGIFHHEVTKVYAGLRGCITIHNNLLVFGCDEDKQNRRSMAGMLERAREKGVTLKISKSTICAAEVKWFGRVYSVDGRAGDRTMCWRDTTTDRSPGCRGREHRGRGQERKRPGITAQGSRCKRKTVSETMARMLPTPGRTSRRG